MLLRARAMAVSQLPKPDNGAVECTYFDAGRCRSCSLIKTPSERQLTQKDGRARSLIAARQWLPPVAGRTEHFRTKVKLVVGGTPARPTLGIIGQDLSDCPIVDERILAVIPAIKDLIGTAALVPYDIPARRGELKNVIITVSPAGELMVRFVLRSTESMPRLRKHLASLRTAVPAIRVVTANLLPEHKAVVEGAEEVVLTSEDSLRMDVGGRTLHLLPLSFIQTNTAVASALYAAGAAWVDELGPTTLWDLYCGVGGFALHVTAPGRRVIGVEVSPEAVASAARSATEAGVDASFVAADAAAWATAQDTPPDLVIVNPPRRGIGAELTGWLEASGVRSVLYSSCNADSLAADLARMPSLRPLRAQVFDMFPHTSHFETLVLLGR